MWNANSRSKYYRCRRCKCGHPPRNKHSLMFMLIFSLLSTAQPFLINSTSNESIVVNVTVDAILNDTTDLPCTPVPENLSPQLQDIDLAVWQLGKFVLPSKKEVDSSVSSGATELTAGPNFTLRIMKIQPHHATIFQCNAYIGSSHIYTYKVTVIVRGPPDPPQDVTAESLDQAIIKVSWTPGKDNNSTLLNHRVDIFTIPANDLHSRLVVEHPRRSLIIKDLAPYSTYRVTVRAINAVGMSPPSAPAETRTLPGVPTLRAHVNDVRSQARSVDVEIYCSFTDSMELQGPFVGYLVTLYQNSRKLVVVNRTINATSEKQVVTLEGLEPHTSYQLSVQVFNGRHTGPEQSSHFTTQESQPGGTDIYLTREVSSDSFTVLWQEVAVKNGKITGYQLQLFLKGSSFGGDNDSQVLYSVDVEPEMRQHTFRDLNPYTWYLVSVAARTSAGYGPFSSKHRTLTDVAAPPAPKITQPILMGTEGLLINWTRPILKKEIKGDVDYKVCWSGMVKDTYRCLRTQTLSSKSVAYCHCNKSASYHWTVVPWAAVSRLAFPDHLTFGVRASMLSIYCKTKVPQPQCEKEGALSNLMTVQLTDDQRKYFNSGSPFFNMLMDQTAITGIIIGVVAVFILGGVAVFLIWRTSCWYRGYEIAEQQVPSEPRVFVRPPPVPDMLSFADSPYPAIPISNLDAHVKSYHADDDAGYQAEFESIDRAVSTDWPTTISRLPDNMPKNRYSNVFAYDHTRVVLQNIQGKKSDYINANYIDGYLKPRAYIAAQGPMQSTFDDFWLMVWEESSNVIVMISNFLERGRRKCDQYWPAEGTQTYGTISVKIISQTQLAFFTIRVFAIRNLKVMKKTSKDRIVYHYQYTDWQDFDVPRSALPVLVFVRYTIRHLHEDAGPIVIHCSAGVGRTGTYICIESLIHQMEQEHQVNVRGFLEHIRQQRMNLVQTEQQYAFIHDALREYLLCPEHDVGSPHLLTYVRCLKEEEPCGCTRLQKQFQLCIEPEPSIYEFMESKKACNLPKSRDTIYPIECRRVNLPGEPGIEGSNYINASHLHGYWTKFEFIVTQHPLDTTEADFWKLVWEENSSIIVLLSSTDLEPFWPCEGLEAKEIGWLRVGYRGREDRSHATRYEFLLSSSREDYALVCHLWHFHSWPSSGSSPECTEMIELARTLSDMKRSTGPAIVVDDFGGNRAGIFCALNILIQQLEKERAIDVYFVFKMFHLQRPHIFYTSHDLEFIYDLMLTYIENTFEETVTSAGQMVNEWIPERSVSPVPGLDNGLLMETSVHIISNNALPNGNSHTTSSPSPTENGKLLA